MMNPAPLIMPLPESPDDIPNLPTSRFSPARGWVIVGGVILALAVLAFTVMSVRPAPHFVPNTLVHVGKDMSLSAIANLLKKQHVIQSTVIFRMDVVMIRGAKSVAAGDYFFQTAPSTWNVADRMVHSEQGLTTTRVTFPEGTSVRGMSVILGDTLSDFDFDAGKFLSLASTSEGYLFPDTYFFAPNVTPEEVIGTMKANFNNKLQSIYPTVTASGHSPHDVVIMASILEKEALTDSDRMIVAGILWKRIAAGQPLQVDSPFAYALGKTSAELTTDDLFDSTPYNTYRIKGLAADADQ